MSKRILKAYPAVSTPLGTFFGLTFLPLLEFKCMVGCILAGRKKFQGLQPYFSLPPDSPRIQKDTAEMEGYGKKN